MATSITLDSLSRHIAGVRAVDGVSLTIEPGELFFLLGPSGCGKTTTLRLIAGFIDPTAGRVLFGDRDVTRTRPSKRNAAMVFQSYALWPHMTVERNVEFGLAARKVARADRRARASRALESVRMQAYAARKPAQLSGGQQQRVALARALVVEPDVLLLDEPLSNLDAALRLEMRSEIRRLCKASRITTVYVTHDQAEALSMADRIAVMRDGRLVQVGTPEEVYRRPTNRFVAEFMGETNLIPATIAAREAGASVLDTPAGRITARDHNQQLSDQNRLVCSVRPESVRLVTGFETNGKALQGKVLDAVYLGGAVQRLIEVGGVRLKSLEQNPRSAAGGVGTEVRVVIEPEDVAILPADEGLVS